MMQNHSDGVTERRTSSRNGKALNASEREKRKSAMLIAAQSLDIELQNVKNLKRLSIGSIDLLIDPELEFRVNTLTSSATYSGNISNNSLDSIKCNEHDTSTPQLIHNPPEKSFIDDTSNDYSCSESMDATGVSFNATGVEYLHHEENCYQPDGLDANNEAVLQRYISDHTVTSPLPSSLRRGISGVGSLRRGSAKADKTIEEQETASIDKQLPSLTHNLLWVPANKHPNVRPENYVELVQDALHNIKLDEKVMVDQNALPEAAQLGNVPDINNKKILSFDFSKNHSSLVRKPSRLRKSYTELEEDTFEEFENTSERIRSNSTSAIDNRKSVTLKDIAEELTKISNNAGLTNSDAITLAMTLSITGSFADLNHNDDMIQLDGESSDTRKLSQDTENSNDDNEFASNILMKKGISIPARSSLRRSKFNTYRIQNLNFQEGGTSYNSEQRLQSFNKRSHQNNRLSSNTINQSSNLMPSTEKLVLQNKNAQIPKDEIVSDVSHIEHSAGPQEQRKSLGIPEDKDQDLDLSYSSFSHGSSSFSSDISMDSVLVRPSNSGSMLQERLEPNNMNTDNIVLSEECRNQINRPKVDNNSQMNLSVQSNDELGVIPTSSNVKDDDFVKISQPERTKSQKIRAERSNHSKNRHSPIFVNNGKKSILNTVTKQDVPGKEPSPFQDSAPETESAIKSDDKKQTIIPGNETISKTTQQKKPRFEKKITNLFKKKTHIKSLKEEYQTNPVNNELKKKSSTSSLRFRRSSEKIKKVETKSSLKIQTRSTSLDDSITYEYVTTDSSSELEFSQDDYFVEPPSEPQQSISALQPAVSVISTKQDQYIIETVTELGEGDISQDISGGSLYADEITANSETSEFKNSELASREYGRKSNKLSDSNVPFRTLTFDDVKRLDRPNGSMEFTDSAFGFPLPLLTVSTVIMLDHRLPVNVERAIYRLSHLKLSETKRALREQVLLSNFMYSYLHLVNHTLYMEQLEQENNADSTMSVIDNSEVEIAILDQENRQERGVNSYRTEENEANGVICIPEI